MRALLLLLLLLAAPGSAQSIELCPGRSAAAAADSRTLGHFPYGQAPDAELVEAPAEFTQGRPCQLRAEVVPDLLRLLAAMRADPAAAGTVVGISCFRPIARQAAIFCNNLDRDAQDGTTLADRAISVAPPGFSEHASGYAFDVGIRPSVNCPDLEACMAATATTRWLLTHAQAFGFELSFPAGNGQKVKWEPWHWRWVGATPDAPGAARARFLFGRARRAFPARPAAFSVLVPPPPVGLVLPRPAVEPAKGKGRKKRRR